MRLDVQWRGDGVTAGSGSGPRPAGQGVSKMV